MKFPIRTLIVLFILGAIGATAYAIITPYWREMSRPKYLKDKVSTGTILATVNATGTVEAVRSVPVGSFVSGPIQQIFVDFNDTVKKGDVLAKIDPRIYQAAVDSAAGQLITRKAEWERVWALLWQAKRNEARAIALRKENPDYISDREMDEFTFNHLSLKA